MPFCFYTEELSFQNQTVKQPVFGILCRQGKVFAEIVAGVETNDLEPLIIKRVKKGSTVCSDGWRAYTGLAARGGIRRERLPLFLGEYVWRYNHRKFSFKEQISILKSAFLRHFRYEN